MINNELTLINCNLFQRRVCHVSCQRTLRPCLLLRNLPKFMMKSMSLFMWLLEWITQNLFLEMVGFLKSHFLASVPVLYEAALQNEVGTALTSAGALVTDSGDKKGRSPKDKRIVDEPGSTNDIWVRKRD